jgi:riboflavin kinase/FMN adenylyltransferase
LKIFNSIDEFRCAKKTILTLGTFDGVHLGHRKILEKLTQNNDSEASGGSYESLVLTFYPHPRMVLKGESEVKILNTISEKVDLLASIGVQNLVIHPFDTGFSQLTAEEFVKTVLVDKFHIQKIIIGHDHRFGKNRTADINDLIAFGTKYDFEVEQISVQEIQDVSISSTKIRNALKEGKITLANDYLGYAYFLSGIVAKGKQLGRTIGIPTANLQIEQNDKLIPANGVYVVKSIIDGKTVFGMMNIGFNPTVAGNKLSVEVHYFNFEGDLYGQEIRVFVLNHLRSEQKFESVALLKAQLEKDKESSFAYINKL